MRRSTVIFPTEEEETLIGLVHSNHCLWNKKDPGYKKRDKTLEWEAVGTAMEKPGTDCKLAWTKIRQQFTAFLRKLAKPSGSARGVRPYFRHEALMMFLKDQIQPEENNETNVDTGTEEEEEEEEILSVNGDEASNVFSQDELQAAIDKDQEAPATPAVVQKGKMPKPQFSDPPNKRRKLDAFDQELIGILKTEEDEHDTFGKIVASKLRQISLSNKKESIMLQQSITQKILEVELSTLE